MRGAARAGLVLLLAGVPLGATALPAYADSASPPAVRTNWYWSLQAPSVDGETLPVGAPPQASGVPDGDLGVAYLADAIGTSDKVAAVAFDLGGIPLGATFSRFSVTVPYDPAATQITTGTPEVSACALLDTFQDAQGPSDLAKTPPLSLPSCVKGVFKSTIGKAGGYEFDLTAVANDWSGGAPANGILLRPTPGLATPQQPFSLSLLGKNGITTAAEYTVAAQEPPVVQPVPGLPPVPPVPGSGYVPPPTVPGVILPPPPPVAPPVPAPQVNPVPTTAPQALTAYHQGALVPSGNWWLGFLGLLALLGLTAAVLGDPLAPAAVDPRRRRFAEVVRTQTRAHAPLAAPTARPAPRFRPA